MSIALLSGSCSWYDSEMKQYFWLVGGVIALSTLPVVTLAQAVGGRPTLRTYLVDLGGFLSDIILPLLFSIAILFFLFNMARYFVVGGANDGERDKAKRNAIYAVAAFVFMFTIWAIVNLFLYGFELSQRDAICPDYYQKFGGDCTSLSGDSFDSSVTFPGGGSNSNSPTSNPVSGGGG